MKIGRLTEKVGCNFRLKDEVSVYTALQKLGQVEEIEVMAEDYGLDLDKIITLAKSQISTIADNCRKQQIIEAMAELINEFDVEEEICKETDSCPASEHNGSCIGCIIDYFERRVK